jgi:hypothetical protein
MMASSRFAFQNYGGELYRKKGGLGNWEAEGGGGNITTNADNECGDGGKGGDGCRAFTGISQRMRRAAGRKTITGDDGNE